jgi:hypothetical protein
MPEANSIPVSPNLAGRNSDHAPGVAANPKLLVGPLEVPHSRHSFANGIYPRCYDIFDYRSL